MAKKTANQITFRLISVEDILFSVRPPTEKFSARKRSIVEYDLNPQLKVDFKTNEVTMDLIIRAKIKQTQEQFAELALRLKFLVKEVKSHVHVHDGVTDININVLTIVTSISISTARGILYEKGKGTLLENQLLPIIDPASMIRSGKSTPILE